jgi:hypothetical protein
MADCLCRWLTSPSPRSGKQTPALKSSLGAGAASNKCLSLLTRQGHHLELEAETVESVSAWLYGIQTVLSKAGKACYVDTDTANKPVQAATARGKRFSVMGATLEGVEGSRHANFKRAILSIPREETLRLLTNGSEFWLYALDRDHPGAAPTRTLVHLFYVPNTSALCWSEPGTRKIDVKRSISVHAIRDLYGESFFCFFCLVVLSFGGAGAGQVRFRCSDLLIVLRLLSFLPI